MSDIQQTLLSAIQLALAGKWDEAHNVAQQYEGNATADWLHAVLHKIEGDLGNARYWYSNAGKLEHVADEPHAELQVIKTQLLARAKT